MPSAFALQFFIIVRQNMFHRKCIVVFLSAVTAFKGCLLVIPDWFIRLLVFLYPAFYNKLSTPLCMSRLPLQSASLYMPL